MARPKTHSYAHAVALVSNADLAVVAEHVRLRELDAHERRQRQVFERHVLLRLDTVDTVEVDVSDLDDP